MAQTAVDKSVDTFPKFLLLNAKVRGDRAAIREKDLGIWQTWTWAQVKEEVKALALGLKELGVERGDKVAIVGSNKPRLYWSMCAAQSIGAVPVPVYQDAVADEMAFVLTHAGAKVAIVENQEQVDKVLSISDRLPSITHVIYDEPRGLRDYDHTRLKWINEVQEIGRKAMASKYSGDARSMPAGKCPALRSLTIASSSSAISMPRKTPVTGMRTRLSSPIPDTQIARSIDECTSPDA